MLVHVMPEKQKYVNYEMKLKLMLFRSRVKKESNDLWCNDVGIRQVDDTESYF